MAFKFRYENVLKLREDEEEQAKNRLAVAINRRETLLQEKQRLQDEKQDFEEHNSEHFAKGIKASDFAILNANKLWFKDELKRYEASIHQVELEMVSLRVALVKATQEKKKMEKLKERALNLYLDKEKHIETEMNDQIVTYQASKKKLRG